MNQCPLKNVDAPTVFYFCKRINRHYYSHIIAIRKEKMYSVVHSGLVWPSSFPLLMTAVMIIEGARIIYIF